MIEMYQSLNNLSFVTFAINQIYSLTFHVNRNLCIDHRKDTEVFSHFIRVVLFSFQRAISFVVFARLIKYIKLQHQMSTLIMNFFFGYLFFFFVQRLLIYHAFYFKARKTFKKAKHILSIVS